MILKPVFNFTYVNRGLKVKLSVPVTKSEVIKILMRENSKYVAKTKI